jgi:hypothetical protein
MTTRETLKNFLNKLNLSSDKISYQVNPASGDPNDTDSLLERGLSDLGADPNTGKELLNFEKEESLLNDYVNFITDRNEYSINKGITQGIAQKRGDSLSSDHGAETFTDNNSVLEERLSSYSNSKYFQNLSEIVDKTSKEKTNHNLLKNIPGSDLNDSGETLIPNNSDNIVLNSVDTVLKQNNRFASVKTGTAFAPRGINEADFEGESESGSHLIQNKFGTFDKRELKYDIDMLKKVGLSMLYKSSGYDTGQIPGESIDPEKLEGSDGYGDIGNQTVLPDFILNNRFVKRDFKSVRALNAESAPKNSSGRPFNEDPEILGQEEGNNSKTFGSVYNDSVHFDGKNRKILMIKASIACKSVINIAKEFYEEIKASITTTPDETNPSFANLTQSKTTTGPYFLGSSRGVLSANLDLIRKSLITATKHDYTNCIDAGIEVMFGNLESENLDSIVFKQSPGQLLAICLSAIKSYEKMIDLINERTLNQPENIASSVIGILNTLKDNNLIKFLNVLATIGDRALMASGGNKDLSVKQSIRNVDSLSDAAGNRPGKHRKRNGRTITQVAWNQNETINSYILPLNIVRASAKLSQGNNSPNPVKSMLGSGLYENTYLSVNNDGAGSRIPNEVVKEIEDRLDAEYVPFYIQDLRTNEIISFHAFLSSLSDTITPNFNSTQGYGRMDPVQIYSDTKRSITVSFTLMATSREDFDLMWYKINKLTTLVYPQWTQGTKVSNGGDNVFIQPFSQVIGASPLVRLRVGDVVKSNYSRFNLSRIFGIGDSNITTKPQGQSLLSQGLDFVEDNTPINFDAIQEAAIKTLTLAFGSPAQYLNIGNVQDTALDQLSVLNFNLGAAAQKTLSAAQETLLTLLHNGFVNPLLMTAVINKISTPNLSIDNLNEVNLLGIGNAADIVNAALESSGVSDALDLIGSTFQKPMVKANTNQGYRTPDQRIIYLSKNTTIKILEDSNTSGENQKIFKALISDSNSDLDGEEIFLQFSDLYFSPDYLFRASGVGNLFFAAEGIESFADEGVDILQENNAKYGATPGLADLAKNLYKKDEVMFMEPKENPFTRAYETTAGRGLAGTLGGLTFDWGNGDTFTWEIDHNARAPKGVKITFNLAVIHDIPPGMDHSGYNRAPLYNVGEIMKHVAGDPYSDGAAMSRFRYESARKDKKSGE